MDRRTALRGSLAAAGGLLMAADVLDVAEVTTQTLGHEMNFGTVSRRLGTLRAHIKSVDELVSAARSPRDVRRSQATLAESCHLLSAACNDALRGEEMQAAAAGMVQAATAACDHDLRAVGWIGLTRAKRLQGDYPAAVRCATTAGGQDARGRNLAWARSQEAAALLALGHVGDARTCMDIAEEDLATDPGPKLGATVDVAWHRGMVERAAGRLDDAEATLRGGLLAAPPGENRQLYIMVELAAVHLDQGDAEAAVQVGAEAFEGIRERGSKYKLARLADATARLADHPKVPGARELRAALADV